MESISFQICGDAAVVEEILRDAVERLHAMGRPMWTREQATWAWLSGYYPLDSFYIAQVSGEAAGCMSLLERDPLFWPDVPAGEALFLHKLAVKRAFSGTGVSGALISFAQSECLRRGARSVRLDCDSQRPALRALYERNGFVCVDEKTLWEKYPIALYIWTAPE